MTESAGTKSAVLSARNERLMAPSAPTSRHPKLAEIEERSRPRTGFAQNVR
jgi:hypothetical protein